MLKLTNLSAGYGPISAITDISLEVPEGRVVSIIGANGAGKSTLLKAASGLIKNKSGRIMFNGQSIIELPADRIVGLGLSQVAEGRQIFAHMSVSDNIHLGAYLYYKRSNRAEINDRINQIYDMFPILSKRSKQIAGTLSGGEQQMLAIARALMGRPKVLLLDEPSLGLAPIIIQQIFDIIADINREEGTTILLVEQSTRRGLDAADEVVVLESGNLVWQGNSGEAKESSEMIDAILGLT